MPRPQRHSFFGADKIGGIRQDLRPYEVPPGQFVDLNAMKIRGGYPDGTDMGTGAYVNGSAMAFELYNFTPWSSANGENYIFAYTSSGKIAYTSDGWVTWDFLETADGTDLTLSPTHLKPAFLVRGNKSMLISNGIDSVYFVDGVIWPGSGALKATALTTCPAFIEGWFIHGVTIIHDGEIVYSSSPLDMDRFISTQQERTDRVYDDNCWVAPAAPGVSGHITKGVYNGEDSILLFTTEGVFWLGLAPDGEGIMRLNIINLVEGAGAPAGAACTDGQGNAYYLTDYNRGDILRLGRAGAGGQGGKNVDIEAKHGWGLDSVGYGLRNTLNAIPASDREYRQIIVDEKGDWERVASALRSSIDTSTLPGRIFINPNAHVTVQGTGIELTPIFDTGTWWSPLGEPMISLEITSGKEEANLYDSNPDYSASETNYHSTGTYTEIVLRNNPAWFQMLKSIQGMVHQAFNVELLKDGAWIAPKVAGQNATFDPNKTGSNSWQSIVFDEIHQNCTGIRLRIMMVVRWSYTPPGQTIQWAAQPFYLNIPVYFSSQAISGVKIFDTKVTTTGTWDDDWTFHCGEIWPEGSVTTQATYYSDPAPDGASVKSNLVITDLTASSASEFGRITARFTKVDNVYYPKLYVRIGRTQYPPKDTNSTTDPTSTGGAGVATADWSAWRELTLSELEVGLKLTDSGFNYSGGAAAASAAGKLWVRFKVVLDLDTKSRLSPVLDRLRFYCIKATLAKDNQFMFAGPDDHIFLCAPSTGASSGNDLVVFYDPMRGAALKTENQRLTAVCRHGKSFYAATGRRVGKLWEGDHNYIYDSVAAATSDVALQRRIETGAVRGRALRALRHNFYVEKLETSGEVTASITPTLFDKDTAEVTDKTQGIVGYSWNNHQKTTIRAKNGYIYYLWVGESSVTPYLYLSKINPSTGAIVQTWTLENTRYTPYNHNHYGLSMCEDLTGDNLLIAWQAYERTDTSSPSRRLSFKKFNLSTETFDVTTAIYTPTAGVYYYHPCIAIDARGDYYLALCNCTAYVYYIWVLKCTDGGTTWTKVVDFASSDNGNCAPQIQGTDDGKLWLAYKKIYGSATGTLIYFREITSGIAGDEQTIGYPSGTGNQGVTLATKGNDVYLVTIPANSTKLYIYKLVDGIMTLQNGSGVSASSILAPAVLELSDGNLMIIYNGSANTYLSGIVGQDESWSSEVILVTSQGTSLGGYLVDACRYGNDEVFITAPYYATATSLDWGYRTIKAAVAESEADSPLQTYVKTDYENILTYSDTELFATPRIVPEDENPGNTGSVKQLSQVLEAYGPVAVASGEMEYIEQQ